MAIKINNNTIINDNRGIVDINGNVGVAGSILTSTGTSIRWESKSSIVSSNQVTLTSTAFSYPSDAYNNILSFSITPQKTTNKIILIASVPVYIAQDPVSIYIRRGSTNLIKIAYVVQNDGGYNTVSGTYIDSPNTTSSVTYHISAVGASGGGTSGIWAPLGTSVSLLSVEFE